LCTASAVIFTNDRGQLDLAVPDFGSAAEEDVFTAAELAPLFSLHRMASASVLKVSAGRIKYGCLISIRAQMTTRCYLSCGVFAEFHCYQPAWFNDFYGAYFWQHRGLTSHGIQLFLK
jgi:hypothetical protein